MLKILIGVTIVAFILIIGFLVIDPDLNPATSANSNNITEVSNQNGSKYTIEGEVYKAGTYVLSDGITMHDLLFDNAKLKAGTTYYIASKFDETDICSKSEIGKVNINEDDAQTLMTVNGITTSIATSIVSYRSENGIYNTIEDLLNVYGIGNATYHKVRNYVVLHK